MLTLEEKITIYGCIKKQFPDPGLYRNSRITEWLLTNGYSMEQMGYASFRDFAKDFTEMFTFQDDNNDMFIKTNNWAAGESGIARSQPDAHPADNFFGTTNIILNDDIIEMSQQSLYALTKILGNGLNVQCMKQQIYECFNRARDNHTLTFFSDKYTFPIDYCADGFLVNGIIKKNISPRGKSLYFSFEKTQIFRSGPASETASIPVVQSISAEDKALIYRLLTENFPPEKEQHMASISKLLNENNIDRKKYGYAKMKDFLAQLDFLELTNVVLGGVPQVMVTVHPARGVDSVAKGAYVHTQYSPVQQYDEAGSEGSPIRRFSTDHPAVRQPEERHAEGVVPDGWLEDFCNMPTKPLSILQSYLEGKGRSVDIYGLRYELSSDFEKARNEKCIRFYDQKMIFPCRYMKDDGSPVEITLKPSAYEGKPWFVYYVDTTVRDRGGRSANPGKQLENFAFLGSWASFLTELAGKAIEEDWDFQNSTHKNYHILIQYIKYTFCRLLRENKVCISVDNEFAAFNTGLVDNHYDDIYACFVPNEANSDTRWKFTGFCTAASRGLGKMLVNYFNPLPQPPRYFTKSEDLFFDLDKQLHPDFDHIIIDNIRRLPLQFLADQFFDNNEAKELCTKIAETHDNFARNALYDELKEIISDNSKLFIRIQNRIKDSIELARKRVRWNYKTAIPSYFPKRDSMSLMLPLCLTDEEQPDVALVVELTQSGNYQGQTILTIPQAYIDARLMCRLSSDWLSPSQITVTLNDSDEQDFAAADDELADTD